MTMCRFTEEPDEVKVSRPVLKTSGFREELAEFTGESGILKSMQTRSAFLSDSSHKIVFHFTPKHCSTARSDRDLVQYPGS